MKPPEIDDILLLCIEQLWDTYDVDDSGYLDREQTRKFFLDTICEEDPGPYEDDEFEEDEGRMSMYEFNRVFKAIDTDGNGTLSKDEMIEFIKKLTGI